MWTLIVMWAAYGSSLTGRAALAVEFNSLEACQAAAKEIRQQSGNKPEREVATLICAYKGDKAAGK